MSDEVEIAQQTSKPDIEAKAKDGQSERDTFLALLAKADGVAEQEEKQAEVDRFADDVAGKEVGEPEAAKGAPSSKSPEPDPATVLKDERDKLDLERAEFERRKAAFDHQASKAKQDLESADKQAADLERYAKEWDETGEHDLAKTARDKAVTIRQSAQAARQESDKASFRIKQEAVLRDVVKDHPELSKPDSQMTKDMDALLRSKPVLLTYPEGIRDAAVFLTATGAMQQTQALQKENAALKAQLDGLQKRIRPATDKGAPSDPRGQSSFEQLPKDQQRAQLLASARKADAGA